MSVISNDPDVIDYGARFVALVIPFYIVVCFDEIYAGALRGIGMARTPTAIMLFSFVFFRQMYLLANRLLGQYFLVTALAYPMGWVMCSILMTIAYRRSKLYKMSHSSKAEAEIAASHNQA